LSKERRVHPRVEVTLPVELDVETYGPTTTGRTVDLSRGGVLVIVNQLVGVGAHCTIRFPNAGANAQEIKAGTVVRSGPAEGGFLVALQFDNRPQESIRPHTSRTTSPQA
jgi:c-di-GMP-binding flagellar brake protein YcgR